MIRFSRPDADVFVPQGGAPVAALARVTHLCIAAHQDDIEIMAYSGICDCLETPGAAFGGVVVTNGAGSPRSGLYADLTDLEMQQMRRIEQRRAAEIGGYAVQIQLGHPSADVKQANHPDVRGDLAKVLSHCDPQVVYLHNPADKHDTHVAVLLRSLEALRAMPAQRRPARVLGCEVWRDLDWLSDTEKVALNAGRKPDLAAELLRTFDSQIAGGKQYDQGTLGRRAAHATFHTSHVTDRFQGITWALDLTPLVQDPALDVAEFTVEAIERFRADVVARIARFT